MSFPHTDNSLRLALKELEDAVKSHQGENHESVQIVREFESIVKDIERKSVSIQNQAVDRMHRPVHAV